jgi:hypothetical protein
MALVNLGTSRIIIILALVAAGAVVLANGFDDDGTSAAPGPSGTESPTDTDSPSGTATPTDEPTEPLEPQVDGVVIAVLNATEVSGLAAEVQAMLIDAGYAAPLDPGDSPVQGADTTTVYYRGGSEAKQNRVNAQFVVDEYFPGGQVDKLNEDVFGEVVTNDDVTLVVQVGLDYAEANAA